MSVGKGKILTALQLPRLPMRPSLLAAIQGCYSLTHWPQLLQMCGKLLHKIA